MARRPVPLTAALVALAITAATLGTAAVVLSAGRGLALGPADLAAIRFTLVQAALSALVSVGLAVPVARALARRSFPGRAALVTLMGAPFLLPSLVAVLGLLAVFGRSGLLNRGLEALGLPGVQIYGLHGVVLAHLFLNLPLATRMLLQGWQAIPSERFRLARSLGLPPGVVFRHIEAPMLRAVLPGAVLTVFVFCLMSFAVALTLGGGPAATTVELAIYQALRFDYDPGRAAALAGVQFGLCAAAVLAAAVLARASGFGAGMDRPALGHAPGGWRRGADAAVLGLAAAFLILPMLPVLLRGLPALGELPAMVWPAALRSILVALASAALATSAALVLALAAARGHRLIEAAATLPLAASALVLGTGAFLVLRPLGPPERLALPVTVAVNALLTLPLVFRLLLPATRDLLADYGRLAASLGLAGGGFLRWVALPRLGRPLGFGAGVAAALSMGDLGVIALFAGEAEATLPLVMHRLMGAYRMEAAAGTALLLVGLSFALFAALDRGGRHVAS